MTKDIYFSQPIQDKEVLAEDEQTFLAKQQVRFFTMKANNLFLQIKNKYKFCKMSLFNQKIKTHQ